MKKVKDFTEEFQNLKERAVSGNDCQGGERDERLGFMIRRAVEAQSQYESVFNSARLAELEEFYEALGQLAMITGGKVVLDVNEETEIGELTYYGDSVFSSEAGGLSRELIAKLFTRYACIGIGVEDSQFYIRVIEKLYDNVLPESADRG